LSELTTFNTTVPADWVTAFEAPVNLGFYRTSQADVGINPAGNVFEIVTAFGTPLLQNPVESPSFYGQSVDEFFYTAGVVKGIVSGLNQLGEYSMNYPNGDGSTALVATVNNDAFHTSGSTYAAGNGVSFNLNGSNLVNSSWTWTQSLVAISDTGVIYPTGNGPTFSQPSDFWAIRTTSDGNPILGAGLGVPASYNVEMILTGTGLGSGFDLIFLPGFFDTYDLNYFQNQSQPQGGCGGLC
jgi:hypothetical protein